MVTAFKFSSRLLLVALLTISSGTCDARSTFSAQELQDLWPFFRKTQPSKYVPVNEVEQTFTPGRFNGNEEPSSRDLDIGFTVGDNEVENSNEDMDKAVAMRKNFVLAPSGEHRDGRPDRNEFSIDVFADPRKSRRPFFEQPGGRFVAQNEPIFDEEELVKWREGWVPRYRNQKLKYWVPAQLTSKNMVQRMMETEAYPHEVADLQNESPLQDQGSTYWVPTPLEDRSTAKRVVLGVGGYPTVISQPLVNKVGTMRLKSDQGYQLAMNVPPMSAGDRPGVLELDMKATLYRPIYY